MFKIILFSSLLSAVIASSYPLTYEETDHSSFGLINVDEVRPNYMIPSYQTHVDDDLAVEGEPRHPLEQMFVEAFPKDLLAERKMIQGNYKGSDGSSEIKHKKHSYEATKITQEKVEIKALDNNYGSKIPYQEYKKAPQGYKKEIHVPSSDVYKKSVVEVKKDLAQPGDYSHSIGEKNNSPMSNHEIGNKHYGDKPSVQEYIKEEYKTIPAKGRNNKGGPLQQTEYESGLHEDHYGNEGGYKGYSNYKAKDDYKHVMQNYNQPKSVVHQAPKTYGIYREGPKKHSSTYQGPSSYHGSNSQAHQPSGKSYHGGLNSANHYGRTPIEGSGIISSHNSFGRNGAKSNGGYNHGIKSSGISGHGHNTGYNSYKDSGYKNIGGSLHGGALNSGHYRKGNSGPSYSGHYNQPKYPELKSHAYPTHSSHSYHGSGNAGSNKNQHKNSNSGYKNIAREHRISSIKSSSGYPQSYGISNMHGPSLGSISNSGHLGYNGKQNHYPRSHHAATISSSYHHNSRNDPKPMKSSGIKHSYPESSSSGYYGSKHPSRHYGSSSGILSTEISGRKPQIDSAGYNSPKGYPIPKISQEKHHYDDHSLSGGIKQTSYHGMDKGLPTYPKSYPIPSKPHYQAQHLSKPSYGISKGGHSTHSHHQLKITQEKHIDDGYRGIGEVSPSYPKSYPIPSKPHYQAQHHPKPSYDISKSGHSTHSHRQHKISQEKHIDDGYSSNGQTGYHGIGEVPPSYPKSYPIPNKPYYQAQNHPKPSYGTISKGSTHNYPQLKISQEKQIDDDHSTYQGIGQSNYHGGDLPSYPKHHPDPIKPHYQPEHHSNSGVKGGHSIKSYPQPKISQEKYFDDYSTKGSTGGIGQSGYHGIGEKSTPPHGSHTVPQKPHYQVEQPSKPVYESIKGGHHATKHTPDYHGIVESHPKSTYDHSHGSSKSLAPTPSKSYKEISGIKGGPSLEDPGHGGKKYLPITSSHNDGYKSGPSGSPIHQHSSSGSSKNYETPKIEQKDEEYGAVLGGHGSQSPAGISGGYGHSSSGSPGSSSHDVYGSDDHYEMSKPMPYEFKYEVKDDEHGADHYRQEKMDDNGYLTGRYGYKDAHGLYRQVEYEASKDGFKVSSIKTNEPGTDNEDPADVHFEVEKNSQPHY